MNTACVFRKLVSSRTIAKIFAQGSISFRRVTSRIVPVALVSAFLLLPLGIQAADKFWIGAAVGNFGDNTRWSTTSGGVNDTVAPDSGDIAFFNGNGLGNCTIAVAANVLGVNIGSGYAGTITQAAGVILTVGSSGFKQAGGTFIGSSGNTDINATGFSDCFFLSGGAFTASSNTLTTERFRMIGGSFFANGGTFILDGNTSVDDQLDGVTFNNLTVNRSGGAISFLNGTPTVAGALTLTDGQVSGGNINVQGAVTIDATFDGGFAGLVFTGSANQIFSNNGGANPTNTWSINKSAGKVTLASDLILGTSQALNITAGTLDQGPSFNLTAGAITIGSVMGAGRLTNQGTGNLTLGDTLTVKSGSTITLNGGGGSCGDADSILIRSSVPGTQRLWSGAGNFFLTDVDVKDQTADASPGTITVFNGTDQPSGGPSSNSNFVFVSTCNPTAAESTVSGRMVDLNNNPVAGVVVYLNGTQNRKLITDASGFYQFDNVETNGFYTVTPSRVNFAFSPAERSFSQIGNQTEAAFTAWPNGDQQNPLDTPEYFVRQHYLDFLGREPDESGFNFWSDQILGCGNDAACVERKRVNVSAAYFLSIEFQQTGYLLYKFYKAAYGNLPSAPVPLGFQEFLANTRKLSQGVIVNRTGWEQALENNKQAYANEFVGRERFTTLFAGLGDAQFVAALNRNAEGVLSEAEQQALVNELSTGVKTRAQALRAIAENSELSRSDFNRAFVLMQYFGYLRRDPNQGPDSDFSGYDFWLMKLNQFQGNFVEAEMVKAFLVSAEYRQRFAQ